MTSRRPILDPDETWVIPLRHDLPESARREHGRIRRVLQTPALMNKAATLRAVCPSGHTLGRVFDGEAGFVFVILARAAFRSDKSGTREVVEVVEFLSLTSTPSWIAICDCGGLLEICRPWLLASTRAAQVKGRNLRAVVPREHPGVERISFGSISADPYPWDPTVIAAHERCAYGKV